METENIEGGNAMALKIRRNNDNLGKSNGTIWNIQKKQKKNEKPKILLKQKETSNSWGYCSQLDFPSIAFQN